MLLTTSKEVEAAEGTEDIAIHVQYDVGLPEFQHPLLLPLESLSFMT